MANTLKFFIVGDDKDGQKALNAIDSKVQSVTTSFIKWGLAATAATAALSISEAAKFETKIAEVSTLLDDTSGLEGMEQAVKDLAIQYGQFPDEQVTSLYSIISAGAEDSAEAIQTLEAANRLAIGGVTDVATAADGLTSILNAYEGQVESVTSVSDSMFVAMRAGKTTIGELSDNIGNVAPIAAEAGVELDVLLAATAALTKGGVKTSVAMNGIRQVIASILKPTAEAQKEAKKLGFEFNSAALESKGLQQFLEDLKTATGGNKDSLTQLFGSVEALGPIFALTGSQSQSFTDIMEDMEAKTGATGVAFGKMDETGGQALKRLKVAGDVLAITIGDQLLPFIADLADMLTGPVTGGISIVEGAFFDIKSTAFSVLGGIAEGFLAIIRPMTEMDEWFRRITGSAKESSAGTTTLLEDLEMFAGAMEEGAIKNILAKDAAIEHNKALSEKAKLLREVQTETKTAGETEEEESVKTLAKIDKITEANQKIIDSHADKYQKISEMAEELDLKERDRELLAQIRKEEAFDADLEKLVENGLSIQEAEDMQRITREESELLHKDRLAQIDERAADERIRQEERTGRERKNALSTALDNTLLVLANGNKTMFELGKKLQIATAIGDMYLGAQKAFTSLAGIPIIGPALGTAAAAAAVLAGGIRVKQIKAQKYGQAHGGLDQNTEEQTMVIRRDEMVLDPGTSREVRAAAKDRARGSVGGSITIGQIIIQTTKDIRDMTREDWDIAVANFASSMRNAVDSGIDFGMQPTEEFS